MDHRCPDCGATLPKGMPAWLRHLTVSYAMTREPVTLGPEDSLQRGVEVMRKHGIRRIPIVMGGSLVGLLVEGDLKRAQPSTLVDTQEEFRRVMEETQIARIMIQQLVTATEQTPLVDAVRMLHDTKYGALPVLADGALVGILTDNDVNRVLLELLEQGG
jgi:acetoin utilization protein AcuB